MRLAGLLLGVVFGLVLSWSGMSDPDVIRDALLFHDAYLYGFFASAVATAAIGLQLVRRHQRQALLSKTPIGWKTETPGRRHIVGSLIFGVGWGVSNACPGPIATQIGQGIPWAFFTLTGALGGVYLFLRREHPETEPACDVVPDPRPRASSLPHSSPR